MAFHLIHLWVAVYNESKDSSGLYTVFKTVIRNVMEGIKKQGNYGVMFSFVYLTSYWMLVRLSELEIFFIKERDYSCSGSCNRQKPLAMCDQNSLWQHFLALLINQDCWHWCSGRLWCLLGCGVWLVPAESSCWVQVWAEAAFICLVLGSIRHPWLLYIKIQARLVMKEGFPKVAWYWV